MLAVSTAGLVALVASAEVAICVGSGVAVWIMSNHASRGIRDRINELRRRRAGTAG